MHRLHAILIVSTYNIAVLDNLTSGRKLLQIMFVSLAEII